MQDKLLTIAEAAQQLGVKPTTLNRWRYNGLKHPKMVKLGHSPRIRQSDLDAFVNSLATAKK